MENAQSTQNTAADGQTAGSYQSTRDAARAKFDATLQYAKDNFGSVDQAREKGKQAYDAADRYIQQNPWQAIGIGAAAGLAIGLLLRRK